MAAGTVRSQGLSLFLPSSCTCRHDTTYVSTASTQFFCLPFHRLLFIPSSHGLFFALLVWVHFISLIS